ncbi:TlpA family protein [Actinomadura kijaniata]|uniref:Thiol-disulfide isomerase/thioredoxin n=1 Tax=Actinomadura namibiensis TaxID=182080 RepID=A0A7W3QMS1_ACTNM|nr:TlpA family protein disulfide reductase [Actinomadura namibiensis]MBA8952844.1 thiol-disulfide isomerase/thioredoxin [Actinomadura namibiensis]
MPYLTAAVVLVGLLGVFNLLLTLRLARTMRERGDGHGDHGHGGMNAGPPVALGPGKSPAAFTAVTTAGESVSDTDLVGVVAFFSAGCDPCHKLAPSVAEHARSADRASVLAVVSGEDDALVDALAPFTRVVVEDFDGPVSTAFRNDWTPALYLLGPDHRIVATGGRLHDLPLETTV